MSAAVFLSSEKSGQAVGNSLSVPFRRNDSPVAQLLNGRFRSVGTFGVSKSAIAALQP